MSNDPRMTYDNTFYEVTLYVHQQTHDMAVQIGNRSAYIPNTNRIIMIDGKPYITQRYALELGLVTEFQFQRMTTL